LVFISELPRLLLRRWYALLVGLVLTGAACASAVMVAPPHFVATAQVLLLPPPTMVPAGGNPYLTLGGLNAVGDVVSRAITAPESLDQLKEKGLVGNVGVGLDLRAAAPIVLITVDSLTADGSLRGVDLVMQELPRTLADVQRQAGVNSGSYITLTTVTHPSKAARVVKSLVRLLVVVVVAGIATTVFITARFDVWLARRTGRPRVPRVKGRVEDELPPHDDARKDSLDNSEPGQPVATAEKSLSRTLP
jgi:hypothetical protein